VQILQRDLVTKPGDGAKAEGQPAGPTLGGVLERWEGLLVGEAAA
jgi:hypothetical protein